ncbi:hypothetical protein MF672_008760 [Actinomadura sp. ATCC 31491]|uniref:YcaO domain-containing protein n=1 Tax=Actinomadura luzonensis TaxID=2805427 RepID=A0ABT0FNF6_9ACTN|nr:hypothetical protein [Actinomadura luzonensis]MCK2213880.1 hypothetical protein [Actinomadura luzonensis]
MRRVGDGGHFDRLLRAARTYWGESPSGERCVVAEVFDQDIRAVVRTLMVAKAVCGAAAARLVVLGDPESRQLAEVFGAAADLQPETPPVALVTGRVDRGVPRDIPVVHVHGTGTLQAYALFPEEGSASFEEELPGRVAAFFEQYVWPHREVIRPSAERVAWQAKSGYQVRTDTERRQLRNYGCARLGLDPGLPTIAVTGHVPGRDTELFELTAQFAASDESANWLFFDPIAPSHPRMKSGLAGLSTNILWSLTDVAVTFEDSDLPAFGIPVIQAGWSEGACCGATHLSQTAADHQRLLEEAVATHAKGDTILGPEQRERARLWLWMRRCGADVPTQLLPHWAHGADYPRVLAVNLRYVERDGDPLFSAVHRMWERREPLLTRFDFRYPAGLSTTLTPARSAR